ncbi:MAG: nucleotidyltransferase domain-containing protein [Gracilimonas sp.]|nr:nucleotidyltransferase domain-containing protein [Gracilimonas sp.]
MNKDNRNQFGLTERDVNTLYAILSKYPEIKKVKIFGSRAKGNHELGSDIDLVVMNKGVTSKTVAKIARDFDESSLPYFVDFVSYHDLNNHEFIDHIDRFGTKFYEQREIAELN